MIALLRKSLFATLISCLFLACTSDVTVKPAYTGASGELLVVAPQRYWESSLRDVCAEVFQPNFPMLPQPEVMFNVLHYEPEAINQLLERHRNVLNIDINPDYPRQPEIRVARNYKAKNQLAFLLKASSLSSAVEHLKANADNIKELLREAERKRYQSWLSLHEEEKLRQKIGALFGYDVILPKGTQLIKADSNFIRLEWEREKIMGGTKHFITTGIALYRYPYQSDSAFTASRLEALRNYKLKRIPGPRPGTHMTTQKFIQPTAQQIAPTHSSFNYAVDFRGLWRTTKSFLGGPFVSTVQLDKETQEIIAAEVFIMAPKFDKREFIKEAEAVVYSLQPHTKATETAQR